MQGEIKECHKRTFVLPEKNWMLLWKTLIEVEKVFRSDLHGFHAQSNFLH